MRAYLLRQMMCLSLCMLFSGMAADAAYAESGMDLQVVLQGEVLSCSTSLSKAPEGMGRALTEGSEVSVQWILRVEIGRKYWLNKTVAEVEVNRNVVPDLVSRSWTLIDQTNGISRRVFSLDEALMFLTALHDFPVVDGSLLSPGQTYRVAAGLSEREGEGKGDGWMTWFGSNNAMAATDFVMP